jgi:hypothetical protein
MENHEKWMELCALASKEQDPAKLLALTQEISRLLEEKRAAGERPTPSYRRIFWLNLQSNTLLSGRTFPKRKTLAT